MSPNVIALLYLAAAILFIMALRGLSSPETSRRGNLLGMAGMTIAIATTLAQIGAPESPLTWRWRWSCRPCRADCRGARSPGSTDRAVP